MTIDISRKSFDHRRNAAWTTTMQGRVMTDAPLNEDRGIRDRRLRAKMVDLIGRAGYPAILPDSFRIEVVGGGLTIGPGRYYVDGHPAENHGAGPEVFDDVLAEMRGPDPVPFDAQPFLPGVVPEPPADGRHLVYLDVWQRDVTHLQDDSIVDPAVAVDTFARRQTVWQVKTLGPVGDDATCATDDADLPGWLALIRPSDARLTTRANPASAVLDPCLLPPGADYRGTDNRSYLFVVHDLAPDGTPLVKFSRTHGVVASRILALPQPDVLELVEVARDDFLRFNPGDWVEVSDEARIFAGEPGTMARVLSVDDPSNTVTLEDPLPAGSLRLVGAGPEADQAFHPVLRRWDQAGQVRDENGALIVDLDLPGADGLIPAPTDGTFIALEDGVEAALTLADPAGRPRISDSWTFVARYADSSVEALAAAPPEDFQHHYSRLALVDAAGGAFVAPVVADCRDPIREAEACCCTVVVAPGGDIQAAIDSLPADLGGCVCLKPGLHVVVDVLRIETANVVLHGESPGVTVRRETLGAVLRVGPGAAGVEVHTLRFEQTAAEGAEIGVVEVLGAARIALRGCAFTAVRGSLSAGVLMADAAEVRVRDCRFEALLVGVMMAERCDTVAIEDNHFALAGEGFEPLVAVTARNALGPVTVIRNRIAGALSGISINDDLAGRERGSLATGSIVAENAIALLFRREEPGAEIGHYGIDTGADATLVRGNRVSLAGSGRVGIRVSGAVLKVLANVVTGDAGVDDDARNFGIIVGDASEAALASSQAVVAQNTLRGTSTAIMASHVTDLVVEGNEAAPLRAPLVPAISLAEAVGARILGNTVRGAGSGIVAVNGRGTEIAGNTVADAGFGIGVALDFAPAIRGNRVTDCPGFGVLTMLSFARVSYVENRVANVGSAGGVAFGLGALFVIGEWHVESNEVLDTGLAIDGGANQSPCFGIIGFLVLEARVESNLVSYSALDALPDGREDRALMMQGLLEFAVVLADRLVVFGFPCQILDNKFVGKGRSALVELRSTTLSDTLFVRFERVFFSDNYCQHFAGFEGAGNATVILAGRAGVAMGNQIKAFTRVHASINFGGMPGTLVGNVTAAGFINHPNFPTPSGNFNLVI